VLRVYWDPTLAALAGRKTAPDFGVFLGAADDVLHGRNPYAGPFPGGAAFQYVYPPLLAVVMSPLALDYDGTVAIWGPFLLVCIVSSLIVLGVRDWRCLAIAAVCPFTRSAIEYGAIGPILVLLVAIAWRFRDNAARTAAAVSLAVAVKLFLWPLVVWLAVTRRPRAAGLAIALALLLTFSSWAVIGFAGLAEYPSLLNRVEDQARDSYSLTALFMTLGAPARVSTAASFTIGALLLGLAVRFARDPNRTKTDGDRRALTATLASSLALTPVVWSHYFVVLLIPIALARPRFSAIWVALLATTALDASGAYPASPDGDFAPVALVTAIALAIFGWCLACAPAGCRPRPTLSLEVGAQAGSGSPASR
jgi:glycosyl transferase family 87